MPTDSDQILASFAAKLAPDATLVHLDLAGGVVTIDHLGRRFWLHVPPEALAEALEDSDRTADVVWGPGVSAVESAARLMSMHLEESLATRAPDATGRWTYGQGFFHPLPPWEMHARWHR